MNKFLGLLGAVLFTAGMAWSGQEVGQVWRYTLLDGSTFVDDCLICARPTFLQPMRGTFDLIRLADAGSRARYVVTNLAFVTRFEPPVTLIGSGTFDLEGPMVALKQSMILDLRVNDQEKRFTNDVRELTRLPPMMGTHLVQTQVNLLHFFSLTIAAAPLREIWFSTSNSSASGTPSRVVTAGDLLSDTGRIVKSSGELLQHLGFMPGVGGNIGTIAPAASADVWFSLAHDDFSETQGITYRRGDLISQRGVLVTSHGRLVEDFQPQGDPMDYGLDAAQVMSSGEILFSVATGFTSARIGEISSGDVLAYRRTEGGLQNRLHRTGQQLLAGFRPVDSTANPGLDAIYEWPSGEIWFSTERGFDSQAFGPISGGDLLSDRGYVVLRNANLLARFGRQAGDPDLGLKSAYIISDAVTLTVVPRITRTLRTGGDVALEWIGSGRAFQVERANVLTGPYMPVSPIMPELGFTDPIALPDATAFYRVRQW